MRRRITVFLLTATALMAVIYGIMMNAYLINGLEAAASFEMKLEATRFAEAYDNGQEQLPALSRHVSFYQGREELPEQLRQLFPESDNKHHTLYVGHGVSTTPAQSKGDLYIFMPFDVDSGKQFFAVKHIKQEYWQDIDPPNIDLLRFLAIPLGITFVLIVFFSIRAILNKVYKPMNALSTWAANLNPEELSRPLPNFGYQEINDLAALLHSSVKGLADSLEREQQFVRHASHELRTPLAIIQSNLELLTRMHPEIRKPERIPFERIQRATANMNKTTETLLWLCLDDDRIPEPEPVALDNVARDLVAENRYLLDGKAVGVDLELEPTQVSTIAHGVRIAMGNLIRNSFQYTAEGVVTISVKDHSITVTNVNRTKHHIDTIGSDYGYGLGLMLIEQITRKSGWQYRNEVILGGRRATVVFCNANNEPTGDDEDLLIPGFRNIFK